MSKKLLILSIIYSSFTFYLISSSQNFAHGAEIIFILLLPVLWIVGFVFLYILYRFDKKIILGKLNKVLFVLCTPIPVLLFLFASYICKTHKTEKIYNKNGLIIKETNFTFRDRTEYRSNNDSKTGELLIDSVRYYDKETKSFKTDIYKGWERFLLSEGK